MNFPLLLLELLKKQGSVSLPGFGTFYLHTVNAVLDKEGKNILPPGAEVAFKTELKIFQLIFMDLKKLIFQKLKTAKTKAVVLID